jgi:hypothetical protein
MGLLVLSGPPAASAQVFLGSRPNPPFEIGPLFIRAHVSPNVSNVPVEIMFSLVVPPDVRPEVAQQDLVLVWPGEVTPDPRLGAPDRTLARTVEDLGFVTIEEGRTPLFARNLVRGDDDKGGREQIPGGAPFVTFVRQGGPLGLSAPATWIRIPWSPRMIDRVFLFGIQLTSTGLVRLTTAAWFERTFWGQRYRLTLSFGDVSPMAIFPLYMQNRDRVIRLSDDPSQISVYFSRADRLRIDQMVPPTMRRQESETLENTELISLNLNPGTRNGKASARVQAQELIVQFGYFPGLMSWAPILTAAFLLGVGAVAGLALRPVGVRIGRRLSGRPPVDETARASSERESGT